MRGPTSRDRSLLARFGITGGERALVLAHQDGCCAICRHRPRRGKKGVLGVDHDHATGETRGLLCLRCNKGLQLFGDSADSLRRAADYIATTPASLALGFAPQGRVGRSRRRWRTKRERRERLAWVEGRVEEVWGPGKRRRRREPGGKRG